MRKDWKYYDFGSLFPISMGKTPPRAGAQYWDTEKKTSNLWVSIADISQNEGREILDTKEYVSDLGASGISLVKKGSLLLSFKLSIGKMAFAGRDLYTNEAIIAIPETKGFDQQFLYYYLSSLDWSTLSGGSVKVKGKTFNKKSLSKIQIPKIPFAEQQEIVSLIDKEFRKVDSIIDNSLSILNEARFLFYSFLREETFSKRWGSKTLEQICSKIGAGATPKGGRKVYTKEGCSLIRSMNVHRCFFKYDDLAHITPSAAEILKGVTIHENDVLFNITGASIARCCVVPKDVIPARVNQHVAILRIQDYVLPDFLSYALNSEMHQKQLLVIGETGSTRQALTKEDLKKHQVAFPSIEEQRRIIEKLDAASRKISELEDHYSTIYKECTELKRSILKVYFD